MSTAIANVTSPLRRLGALTAVVLAAAAVVRLVVLPLRGAAGRRRFLASLQKQQPKTVYLYGFPRPKAGHGFSTPVLKVETFLRLNRIPFEYVNGDISQSPTGRMPYISYNGRVIAESDIIIDFLSVQFSLQEDTQLSAQQQATGHAVKRMLDMHSYHCGMRALLVDNAKAFTAVFQREMGVPALIARYIVSGFRKNEIDFLNRCGLGDLTSEECQLQYLKDLRTLAALINDGPFLFGGQPTSYDCAVFAFLYTATRLDTLMGGVASPALEYLRSNRQFAEYVRRVEGAAGYGNPQPAAA